MIKQFAKTGQLVLALGAGALLPQAHVAHGLIRYCVMGMLLCVFVRMRPPQNVVRWSHLWIVLANLCMGLVGYGVVMACGGDENLRLTSYFIGAAPTATAAPVVMGFLGGCVEYVLVAFALTHLALVASFPVIVPWLTGATVRIGVFGHLAGSMGVLVGVPMIVAWCIRRVRRNIAADDRVAKVGFVLWCVALFLVSSNAVHFLQTHGDGWRYVCLFALIAFVMCVANFTLGVLLARSPFRHEASQSLGQKNTMLMIALAVEVANPLVALGPTFYLFFHNVWNAIQLARRH